MRNMKLLIVLQIFVGSVAVAQTVGGYLPRELKKSDNYLIYLHGGVVTVLGNNALNRSRLEWGPYQYLSILDSLRDRAFHVISENRREGVHDSLYADKIS